MDIDAVVTDIDGVLVDTSESYHRAIVESVRAVYGETIDRTETQAFKNAGGFNNDWVTTDAVALYVLARRNGYDGDVDTFTAAIAARNGGLDSAKAVLADELAERAYRDVIGNWDATALRRTFQWLYLGPNRYERFEDEPPPEHRPADAGLMDDEPVILREESRTLLESLPYGVLTGRPRNEAVIALTRVGLEPPPDRMIAMEDWDGSKPDPAGLVHIASSCKATEVLYVGDELDDVTTAVNATETDAARNYYGIGVLTGGLSGEAGRQAFQDVGATAVLDSINELPEFLDRT